MVNNYNKSKKSRNIKSTKKQKFKKHVKSSNRYHPPKINYWERPYKNTVETTRTIKLNIIYSCCYDGIYNPEPIPINLHDTDVYVLSLEVWAEIYLNSAFITNLITEICNDKCRRVMGSGAQLCEDGYNIEVLDMYED